MRNVFMSFLGLGAYNKEKDVYMYRPTKYELAGKISSQTEFVQVAELELLKQQNFDVVYIIATNKALEYHEDGLSLQLGAIDIVPKYIRINDELGPEGQWHLFETILDYIQEHDRLTLDFTHGFRSMPIIFSSAINFLQQSKKINLGGVYYGAFEAYNKEKKCAPIVNMRDFYVINDWAEAVNRLVEDADAAKVVEVAEKAPTIQTGSLENDKMIKSISDLTKSIRNVQINSIGEKACKAVMEIDTGSRESSSTVKILLKLIRDKYGKLAHENFDTFKYDREYFKIQLELINLLLQHELFMQAFTVMREYLASMTMIPFEIEGLNNKKRKKKRGYYAEIFMRMLQYDENEWDFNNEDVEKVSRIKPFYLELKTIGVVDKVSSFIPKLMEYRNGFDHAWTSKSIMPDNAKADGQKILASLERIYDLMLDNKLMP